MKALDKKLLRDVVRLRDQVITIALVVAAGIAVFVAMLSTYRSLEQTRDTYYERHRFAHVFAQLKRAPLSLRPLIAALPGVREIDARLVFDVSLDIEGMVEPAIGRLVSVPSGGEGGLNRLFLREGRLLDGNRPDEVLVNEGFALAHSMHAGDRIVAVVNGRKQAFTIVGVALSPEYVFQMRGGDFLPDDKRFGVMWVDRAALVAAFGMAGAFNDVAVELGPEASEADVKRGLDGLLAPYGCLGAAGRDEQQSARYVSEELKQLKSSATTVPTVFLAVAAFLLNVVLSRLVARERESIGALKALGYGDFEIAFHYLKFVLVVVVIGTGVGIGLGVWIGRAFTSLYTAYYRFPVLEYKLDASVAVLAALVSLVASGAGAFGAARRAARLPPAEAMRPEAPPTFKPGILERVGVYRLLSQSGRMILRGIERKPGRTLLSATAIALATAIMISGSFGFDSIDYLVDLQFRTAQRDDVTVLFSRPLPEDAARELLRIPGVLRAEPMRAVPADMKSGHISHRTALFGLPRAAELRRLIDADGQVVSLPAEGLVLTVLLAKKLGVRAGDTVRLDLLEGERRSLDVPVAALVDELVGIAAYVDIRALPRITGEGDTVSGAMLLVDPARSAEVYTTLKNLPNAAGVTQRETSIQAFNQTSGQYRFVTTLILSAFASIIAIGVVYNGARVALGERSRELASLRVLGMTTGEISVILLGDLAIQTAIGIPLGLWLGSIFADAIAAASAEAMSYRFPAIVSLRTYLLAAFVIALAAVISALFVRRELRKLDLVSVLKARE